jgi:hypothetical protein
MLAKVDIRRGIELASGKEVDEAGEAVGRGVMQDGGALGQMRGRLPGQLDCLAGAMLMG